MSVLGKRGLDDDEEENDTLEPNKKRAKLSNHNNQHKQNMNEIILNVGGIKYMTSIQTLTGYNSMLKARFSSKYQMEPSQDGSYFIDADGELFKYILKYLRTGTLTLPSQWKKEDIWTFYVESKYFMIESLNNKLLLKLWESKLIPNESIKLQIVSKIINVLNCDKIKAMESLNEWKRSGSISSLNENNDRYLLYIVSLKSRIFGMFITQNIKKQPHQKNTIDESKSFAFYAGLSTQLSMNNDSFKVEFQNVTRLRDDEIIQIKGSYKKFQIILPFRQFTVIYNHENFGQTKIRYLDHDSDGTETFQRGFSNYLWAIPICQ